jgi:UDP-N-acetyl-D-mannosaminuronate dehydrogenase
LLKKLKNNDVNIGVIGLGYFELPLAVDFGKKFDIVELNVEKSSWLTP